ncbi:MAG: ribosome-binding factor A, partial [Planctomycetota bacterium]
MANPRTIARIEARIQRRAAHCLQFELSDPRGAFITVTGVKMASDLSSGKISYSVLGDDAERARVKHMLDDAAGFIQRQIARVLEMRNMPRLSWIYDDSVAHAAHIDDVIQAAIERDREIDAEYDQHPETETETETET